MSDQHPKSLDEAAAMLRDGVLESRQAGIAHWRKCVSIEIHEGDVYSLERYRRKPPEPVKLRECWLGIDASTDSVTEIHRNKELADNRARHFPKSIQLVHFREVVEREPLTDAEVVTIEQQWLDMNAQAGGHITRAQLIRFIAAQLKSKGYL